MVSPDFGQELSTCFDIESIDIGGCRGLGDDFFMKLSSGERLEEGVQIKPGFQ